MAEEGRTMYGDIPEEVGVHCVADFLEVAQPNMMLLNFAQHEQMPLNKSQMIKFRRYEPLPAAPKKLVEGVTPKAGKLRVTDVFAQLDEYGDLIEITNRVTETHEDPVIQMATTRLGESAGEMLENVAISQLLGGTCVYYANGASRSAVNTKVSKPMLRGMIKALKVRRAKFHTKMLKSSNAYGTVNVPRGYVAFVHPSVTPDLQDLPGFKKVEDYAVPPTWENEIGAFENCRFLEEDLFVPWEDAGGAAADGLESASGVNCNVYPILMFGRDFFGAVALKGYKSKVADSNGKLVLPVEIKVIQPDKIDKSDPLGQRGTIGYRTWFVCKILQEIYGIRGEVAVSE